MTILTFRATRVAAFLLLVAPLLSGCASGSAPSASARSTASSADALIADATKTALAALPR